MSRDPAGQDVRRPGAVGRAVPGPQPGARRAADPAGDGRPLVLHDHRHDLLDHARVRVLARGHAGRQRSTRRPDGRRHRGVHDAPEPAVLPARPAAQRPGRDPGLARAVRPDLRVPRPRPRDRRRARRGGARAGRRSAAPSRSRAWRSTTRPSRGPPGRRSGTSPAADRPRGEPGSRGGRWSTRRRRSRTAPVPEAAEPEVAEAAAGGRARRPRSASRTCRSRRDPGELVALVGPVGRRQDDDDLPHPAPVRRRPRAGSRSTASTSARSSSSRWDG